MIFTGLFLWKGGIFVKKEKDYKNKSERIKVEPEQLSMFEKIDQLPGQLSIFDEENRI